MSFVNKISPPTGSITAYLGTNDPPGWVIMDGVQRTNSDGRYNGLIAMGIGTSVSGNYTPPNYKGRFLRGNGSNPNNANNSSAALGQAQNDAFESHNHGVNDPGHRHTTQYSYEIYDSTGTTNKTGGDGNSFGSSLINSASTNISILNSGGTETRPFNYAINWILKI